MFTGIVQEIGTVATAEQAGGLRRLRISASIVTQGGRTGDSIAIDGACLTVVRHDGDGFDVEVVPTTLERTTLGGLAVGSRVNLERALAMGERLGGHIVQGHVDGVGAVTGIARAEDATLVDVTVPDDVFGVTVVHGSITLAGVSLTVNKLPAPGVVQVSLIPFTLEHTTLGALEVGDRLNVEADLVAKLVSEQTRRWLETRAAEGAVDTDFGREAARGSNVIR